MINRPLREDEIEILVYNIESFVKSIIDAYNDPSFGLSLESVRADLKNYFTELIGEEKKPVYDTWKCPDCGGEMVARKSQHGAFWGCKKYPDCSGTRDTLGRSKAERADDRNTNSFQQQEGYKFERR